MDGKKIKKKEVSASFATGGGGHGFEARVQSTFAIFMLEAGKILDLPPLPIHSILLQAREKGYCIDDLVVLFGKNDPIAKLLCQVKHRISISKGNSEFAQVIRDAWEDFNNPQIFSPNKDFIALITGPLSATDIDHTRPLLEWAREIDSGDEYETKVKSKSSSKEKENKLNVFREHLKAANNNIPLTSNQLLNFLKRFYLISIDLDIKSSMTKSLLHTIIGDSDAFESNAILAKIKDEIEYRNANGTSITISSFSEDIQSHFREKRTGKKIPAQLVQVITPASISLEGNDLEMISSVLLGSWDLNSPQDIERLSELLQHNVTKWAKLFPVFFMDESGPVRCRTGNCEVKDRVGFWVAVGPRISDKNLDLFKNIVMTILKERDPTLDLSPNMRFAGSLFKKEFKHSQALRKGVADTLALLACRSEHLNQCTRGKPKAIADKVVHELLYDANWETWASLGTLLPILAEASPEQFLKAFEQCIKRDPNFIKTLYAEGSSEIIGTNYTNGILWALETIAWNNDLFINAIINIGALIELNYGSQRGNKPINSLIEIFLPWAPHTTASVEKRKTGLKILRNEYPELTWQLLLKLLGNKQLTSFGTRKPFWRQTIPSDWKENISREIYTQSVADIGSLAIEMAKESLVRLGQLCHHITELPNQALVEVIPLLGSKDISDMPEIERLPIWNSLMTLVAKHRRFSDTEWALDSDNLDLLTKIAIRLQPNSPTLFYKHMFNTECYFIINESLVMECEYQEQETVRMHAIQKIVDEEGLCALIAFAENVANPLRLGVALGQLTIPIDGSKLLPDLLDSEIRHLFLMAKGFVQGNFNNFGWDWVERQPYSNWSSKQKGLFFSELPFSKQTWEKVNESLGLDDGCYWTKVEIKLNKNITNLDFAIDNLIEYGKLENAIECLSFQVDLKQFLNTGLAIKALLALPTSGCKLTDNEMPEVLNVISALQGNPDVNNDDLIAVEWAFLPIKRNYPQFRPKRIEERLAIDPMFFCEVIKLTYRSDKDKNFGEEVSEQQRAVASLTWDLLKDWRLPPGLTIDKGFSKENFESWLKAVQTECERTGYLKVAMNCIGQVLVNVPTIDSNFPMCRDVAEIINDKDHTDILQGYQNGILDLNSIEIINKQNPIEQKVSLKYKEQATVVEEQSYYRIATMLREVANYYEDKAIWVAETFQN
jgi:hypothetical protein